MQPFFVKRTNRKIPADLKDKMSYTANFMSKTTLPAAMPCSGSFSTKLETDQISMKLLWFILFAFVLFKFVDGIIEENR